MCKQAGPEDVHELVAGCAAGLENLVLEEVRSCGALDVRTGTGLVRWRGTLLSAYRCCLWSRFASRVFLTLSSFTVNSEEELYDRALAVEWQKHLGLNTTFAVTCTLSGDAVFNHSRYAALKIKDAIADYFREKTGRRPSVKTDRPDVPIHLHVEGNQATISLDLSGESLHRRGYRDRSGKAPLKETLAAAIVALSGWQKEPVALIDPMCGTGTLLIEAAMMYGDSAPGLSRSYFGFLGWLGHKDELWRSLVTEAVEKEERASQKEWPVLIGYDCDREAVAAARKNIQRAGFEAYITVNQAELATLAPPPETTGMLLVNPPYGERLSEKELVGQLYRGYGRILRLRFPAWKAGVFLANPELTDSFGLPWQNNYRLFNGAIPCRLLVGEVPQGGVAEFHWHPKAPSGEKDNDFGNRLQKNLGQLLKWSSRHNISCFRVYDRDLPDFNLAVDLYGKWAHVQEYAPPKTVDPGLAAARFALAVKTVKEVLGMRSDRVFLKTRERQKGKKQYEKKGDRRKMYEVREGACSFLVNFTDYLDTGLFLDHRPVRERIYGMARGRRFLNLFGYTGTASVHAALGGATGTVTVDLSATYLQWARMNFALNGLGEVNNRLEQADCLTWLAACKSTFDLIFVDPPTFSNTKKEKRIFDVQQDHGLLLHRAMSHLSPAGVLIFSTNFRRFMLDDDLGEQYLVTDISRESLSFDFARNQRIHRCWEMRHRP